MFLQVPYGGRVVLETTREEVHSVLLGIMRHNVVPALQKIEAKGALKPHLRKVISFSSSTSFSVACEPLFPGINGSCV